MRDLESAKALSYEHITQRNYGVFSKAQQEQIRAARVGIVGVGCDGGMAALILARVGVGHLSLVDFDIVEPCNLNRQPLCNVSNLGQKKVVAAKELLLDCNPFINITAVDSRVTERSDNQLIGHDVILQCVDTMAGRVALHRVARRLGMPVVSMTGQPPYRAFVSTFLPDGPEYEDVMGLPSAGRALDCDVERTLNQLKFARARNAAECGATPGWSEDYINGSEGWGGEPVGWGITPDRSYITATIQAHEALRIITKRPLLAEAPRAVIIDLLTPPNLVTVREPPNGKTWDFEKY